MGFRELSSFLEYLISKYLSFETKNLVQSHAERR